MTSIEIRKGKGIEDLVKGYTPIQQEDGRGIMTGGIKNFDRLYDKFEFFCNEYKRLQMPAWFVENRDYQFLKRLRVREQLTPEEVNMFFQGLFRYETLPDFSKASSTFLSKLIRNSHGAGSNDFCVNNRLEMGVSMIGRFLRGSPDNPIRVTVEGNAMRGLGGSSGNTEFILHGNGDDIGTFSGGSSYDIHGDAGLCAFQSHDGTYVIRGKIIENEGMFADGAESCTFKTDNSDTLKRLIRDVPSTTESRGKDDHHGHSENKIVLIHPDGTEEVIRDYNGKR